MQSTNASDGNENYSGDAAQAANFGMQNHFSPTARATGAAVDLIYSSLFARTDSTPLAQEMVSV
jgi:hypothetical protein